MKPLRLFKPSLFEIFGLVFVIALAVFVTYHWFSGGTILYYWDANVPLDTKVSWQNFLYPWSSNKLPGFTGSGWSWFVYWGVLSFFKAVFHSLSSAQWLLYVTLIVLSIVNFYFLFRSITVDILPHASKNIVKAVSLLFGIGYGLNLYTFYYSYFMFNPEAFVICFFPLNFLALYRLFPLHEGSTSSKRTVWFVIYLFTQIMMMPGFTSYVFFLQYVLLLVFYFLLRLVFSKDGMKKRSIIPFVLLLLITFFIHWSWFYPSKLGFAELYASQVSVGNLDDIEITSKNMSLLNLFRLFGGAMMNNNAFPWDNILLSQSVFMLPLFFFLFSIVFLFIRLREVKQRVLILFFSTILLVSLFVMKMGNPPFVQFMNWLVKTIPYMNAFRESVQKAGLFFLPSFFVLSGLGLLILIGVMKKRIYKILFSSLVVLPAFLLLCSPFIFFRNDNIKKIRFFYGGTQYEFSAKTIVPAEYYDLKAFLEPICQGKNTLVYPRTGLISSAIWKKYRASYVGQDYLLGLINCTISSAQLIHTEGEAERAAVYGYIDDYDIVDFKRYLILNKLHFVLIQKDAVPYLYTSRPDIHYSIVESWLENDRDFTKKFVNDYFTLFEYKPLIEDRGYGFALSSNAVYTNAKLTTSSEYENLFHALGEISSFIIFQRNDLAERFSSLTTVYDIQSNCVGCVKIPPSKTQENIDTGFFTKLKQQIKLLLPKKKNVSEEEQISLNLIQMNNVFHDLLISLNHQDYQAVAKYVDQYIILFNEQKERVETFPGDFFAKNNKHIEMRNFIIGENDLLTAFLRNNGEDIKKYSFERLYLVSTIQNEYIQYANTHIWETDTDASSYKARLDVPIDGLYTCSVETQDQLGVKEVKLDSEILQRFNNTSIFLKRGSYALDISYTNADIPIKQGQESAGGNSYELGALENGSYKLKFSISSNVPKNYIAFVTNGELEEGDLEKIIRGEQTSERVVATKTVQASKEPMKVELSILLDEFESADYYFHIFRLDTQKTPFQVESLQLHRIIKESSIVFHCYLQTAVPNSIDQPMVTKKNPVSYQITIPKISQAEFLTFNQPYHSEWEAYVVRDGKRVYLEHLKNGYANAWVIGDAKGETIYVRFIRWDKILTNLVVCIVLVVVGSALFFIVPYGKKRNQ